MTLKSIQSVKTELYEALQQCRGETLDLFIDIDYRTFSQQAHPDFSPIGWHLGHIAFTEAYWILEHCAGFKGIFPEYRELFTADGLPKHQRQFLPSINFIQDYLHIVRQKVLDYLEITDIDKQERLWRWLIQHESQHNETIIFILQMLGKKPLKNNGDQLILSTETDMVKIPAGVFEMGNNSIEAQDNESPQHQVYLDSYWIDTYPVTCQQYQEFIEAGGYHHSQWWSHTGWQWLQNHQIIAPLYDIGLSDKNNHPVSGVSYYEAEAFANFIGKRLPTEAEWEKAASWDEQKQQKSIYPWQSSQINDQYCNYNNIIGQTTPVSAYPLGKSAYGCYDMLGNVWEWTNSWFDGYQGFIHYPYVGYSQTYFDGCHKVLKGGSWATRLWAIRASFRNWYYPEVRQILAGFRCVAV